MLNRWQNIYLTIFLSQTFLGISWLYTPKAIANPSPETSSEQVQVNVAESTSLPLKVEENILNAPPQISSVGALSNVQTSLLKELETESNLPIPPSQFLTAQEKNSDLAPINSSSIAEELIKDDSRWYFKFQPYVNIPFQTYGTNSIRDRSIDYNLSLGELLSKLKFILYARTEAWNNNFGLIFDGSFTKLGGVSSSSFRQTTLSANTSFSQGVYDFALSYHIGDPDQFVLPDKPSNKSFPQYWVQPIVGVRINSLEASIDASLDFGLLGVGLERSVSRGRTWLEPMLGAKLGVQVSDPIVLWLRGDVSGFGLAGTDNLSWNIIAGTDWWISPTTSLQFAYRFYEINFSVNDFGYKSGFNGPFLGATFNF